MDYLEVMHQLRNSRLNKNASTALDVVSVFHQQMSELKRRY